MNCPRCQQDAPPDAEFCPECGAKLAAVCGSCGTAGQVRTLLDNLTVDALAVGRTAGRTRST
jgi:predicted amidophosphoribosyltransferase